MSATSTAQSLTSDSDERQAIKPVPRGGAANSNVSEIRLRAVLRRFEAMATMSELSDSEFRALFQIAVRDRQGEGCSAAAATMAESMGKSPRSAERALSALRTKMGDQLRVATHPTYRTKVYRCRFAKDAHEAIRRPRAVAQSTPTSSTYPPRQECRTTPTKVAADPDKFDGQSKINSSSKAGREFISTTMAAKPKPTPNGRPLKERPSASSKTKAADAAERAEKLRRNSQKWISTVDHLVVPAMPSWTNIRMGLLRRTLECDDARVRQRGYDVLREAFERRRLGDDQETTAAWIESQFREVDPGPNRTEANL